MKKQPILKLENIHKSYPSTLGPETHVLSDINLTVDENESIAIIGPSGSGKSTLLNIMGILDKPSSGKMLINGDDPSEMSDNEQALIRNRDIGFVFQLHHLLPQCTVLENVLLPVLACKPKADGPTQERALRLLDRVDLTHCIARKPSQLSGGECQRVAVVRALINQPKILLADEPTGSLDKANSRELAELLAELNKEENVTMIVVTHSDSLADIMGQTFTLSDGNLSQ